MKVYLQNQQQLTTQLYLPTELTDNLYANHPSYKTHGMSPYNHQNDGVIALSKGAEGLIMPTIEDVGKYKTKLRLLV